MPRTVTQWLVAPGRTILPGSLCARSACDSFEQALRDVEVCVDLAHVVELLERIDQAKRLARRGLVVELDRRLRHHRRLRGLDLDSGLLERLADRAQGLGRRGHLEARAVLGHVLCASFSRSKRDA